MASCKSLLCLLLVFSCSAWYAYANTIEFNSIPAFEESSTLSLNGHWKFKYFAGQDAKADENFIRPEYDVSSWGEIKVPGHWELQGYATPRYAGELADGLGLYRRTFQVAKAKSGERRYLRFEGVLFGYTVWLNGQKIGEWNSGFNPATFDVTDVLREGENVLSVRISTRGRGWDFDTMDCWSISGIYREVTLYTLPATHLLDHVVRTLLKPDGSAEISLDVHASTDGEVLATLLDPDDKPTGNYRFSLGHDGKGHQTITQSSPRLWTAETPLLYRLQLELLRNGKTCQRLEQKVGLRQISTDGGILRLNGTPIKLRGVDHHEIWPEEGRVSSEERVRKDLELMKAANINFIRTSHYPPHPRLLEIADEMGLYVDCEVPFIHGREHLKNPTFQTDLNQRAQATVSRDKNHPCIILWTLGNENHVNELGLNAGRLVKQLDPTRPISYPTIGSYFRTNWEKYPDFVDLYSPHYPSGNTITEYANKLTRPIVVTEYAHMRGISRGGKGLQDTWDAMYANPRSAGGAIWQFEDQGILREAKDFDTVPNGDLLVWLDSHHYYDTYGYFGVDGIVYSDRTPQVDYWWVRKVYSPIQIEAGPLNYSDAQSGFKLVTENRHDFRSLQGYTLRWSIKRNTNAVDSGEVALKAAAKKTETIIISPQLVGLAGDDVYTLELQCLDPQRHPVYEKSLRIETGRTEVQRSTMLQEKLAATSNELTIDTTNIKVNNERWTLLVNRLTGAASLSDAHGTLIFKACGPHTGRKLIINELGKKREGESKYWSGELLMTPADLQTSADKTQDGIIIKVTGTYARPGHPEQGIKGAYELSVQPSGAIRVNYHYVPVNAKDNFVETGFTFATPADLSEFRWLGMGPYANYDGKDRHADYGLHHLGCDDIYFPGQRRSTELALITAPNGVGIALAADGQTICVENRQSFNLLTHVSEISKTQKSKSKNEEKNLANDEGIENKLDMKGTSLKSIAGNFVIIPLQTEWPAPLKTWFGPPGDKATPFHPFLRSYDQ
jgi:beta-galactosidase